MNVLFILPYCYVPGISRGSSTGFGIYTIQIAEELAKKKDINVFVLTMKQRFKKDKMINGVIYIGASDVSICLNAFRKKTVKNAIKIYQYNYYKQNVIKKIMTAIYSASKSTMLGKIINKYSIDLIHVHSLAQELYGVFKSQYLLNYNSLVTIHSDFIKEERFGVYKDYFRNTTKFLFDNSVHVSFVSTGVRNNFVSEIGYSADNLKVIVNGTRIEGKEHKKSPTDKTFTFVCIGTIGERKNQLFLLNALSLIREDILSEIRVKFLGRDDTEGEFDDYIQRLGLADVCENCGFVSPKAVEKYLANADGIIMVSVTEAFGLSIIEGFQYGLPALTYSDLAATVDFYSKDAVMLIEERTLKALADAICSFISKQWDRKKIRNWGKRFQLSRISDEYVDLYNEIIGG